MIINILFKKWQKVYKKILDKYRPLWYNKYNKGRGKSLIKRKEVIKNERSKILVSRRQHDVR